MQQYLKFRKITTQLNDYLAYTNLISQLTTQYKSYEHSIYVNMINGMNFNEFIYFLEINNDIIGTIKIIVEKKFYNEESFVAHIEDVVIDLKYRGKGYGKKIIEFGESICREKQCYKVLLYCSDHNLTFYEKCGFLIDGNNLCKRLIY